MEIYQQVIQTIALALGAAFASGINLYATILVLGLLGATGHIDLPPNLVLLADPLVIGVAAVLYGVEFFADKVPAVDHAWDAVHSFIRPPMGALLAAAALGPVDPALLFVAALLGGSVALVSHGTKATTRMWVNLSPEPVSNAVVSTGEDALAVTSLGLALWFPFSFLFFLALALLLSLFWLKKMVNLFWPASRRCEPGKSIPAKSTN